MRTPRPKRPADINQLAKFILDRATSECAEPEPVPTVEKDPAAVKRGKAGGVKGGKVRGERMTPEDRKEAARKAAHARWGGGI